MHLILVVSVAATLAITAVGCSGDPAPSPAASGGQSATGGSSGTSTGGAASGGQSATGGSSGASTGGAASGGGSAVVGYAKDVQPILKAKCGTCHSGSGQGGHNLTTTYADAKKPAQSLQFDECWADVSTMSGPKTMGECALLLTRAGKMPAFEGCDAPTPPDPSKCLTKAEVDVLAAWVAGGLAP